jgi:hypothetical protein
MRPSCGDLGPVRGPVELAEFVVGLAQVAQQQRPHSLVTEPLEDRETLVEISEVVGEPAVPETQHAERADRHRLAVLVVGLPPDGERRPVVLARHGQPPQPEVGLAQALQGFRLTPPVARFAGGGQADPRGW